MADDTNKLPQDSANQPDAAPEKRHLFEDASTLTVQRKHISPLKLGLIVLACAAVLIGGGYLATKLAPQEAAPEATTAPNYTTRLIEKSTTDVEKVTVNYDGDNYTIIRDGEDGFALDGDENFSLDQKKASSLISRGGTLTSQSTVVKDCQDLAQYGLDNPVATLTAHYNDGTEATIELGNKSPLSYYYIKMAGSNDVYTAYSSIATTMMTKRNDLHTVEMPATLNPDAMEYVRIERPETSVPAPVSMNTDMGALLGELTGIDEVLPGFNGSTLNGADTSAEGAAEGEAETADTEGYAGTTDAEGEAEGTEPDGEAGDAETEGETETTETEGETGTTDTEGEAGTTEPAGEAGTTEPDGEAGTTEPEGEAGSTEPDGETEGEADTTGTEGETESEADATASPKVTIIEVGKRDSEELTLGISAFKLLQPFVYDVDSEQLTKLTANVAAIKINAYVGNVSDPDNNYGMDNPLRINARDADGNSLTLLIGNNADADNTYICVDDTGDVYLTATSSIQFARTITVNGIVDRFANIVNITKVDSLEVTTPDGSYTMSIERIPEYEEDGVTIKQKNGKDIINEVYYFNGEECDEKKFKGLYQSVIGVLVNGVTEDYDIPGDAVITVKYNLNIDMDDFTVEYIEYDRDNYAVRRDGHTYFYVKKSTLDNMRKALIDFNKVELPQ